MLTNKQVAEFVSVVRPFFAVTDGEIRILERFVKTEIDHKLQREIDKRKEMLNASELKKIIEEIVTSRDFLMKLAIEAKRMIYSRVKSGFGVSDDKAEAPSKVRLKALSRSYKLYRAGKIAFARSKYGHTYSYKPTDIPKLGEFGTVGMSNLTLTGQMLNAIRTRVVGKGANIYIDNNVRTKD